MSRHSLLQVAWREPHDSTTVLIECSIDGSSTSLCHLICIIAIAIKSFSYSFFFIGMQCPWSRAFSWHTALVLGGLCHKMLVFSKVSFAQATPESKWAGWQCPLPFTAVTVNEFTPGRIAKSADPFFKLYICKQGWAVDRVNNVLCITEE